MAFTPRRLMRGASGAGGYKISRSLRFNSADTTNLNRTFASAGNRRTFTLSFWLKRSRVGVDYEGFFASGNGTDQIRFENIDQLRFSLNSTASGDFVTTQVFRDVSAWYHIVFAVDTTQATSTNRVKIYVNGSQITSFTTSSYPTLNYDCNFNSNVSHRLGIANDTSYPFNGYITETYLIDGTQLTPSSFGETNAQTGVWQPKAYSGSYGTNGFYLNFSDNSNTTAATLGKDYSGNGNNWTPNNFSVTAGAGNDSLVDTPTPYGTDTGVGGTVRGNYCTFNPLQKGADVTLTEGNLKVVGGYACKVLSTIGMSSGTWYCEMVMNSGTNANFGLARFNTTFGTGNYLGDDTTSWCYATDGKIYTNGTGTVYGNTYTVGDVIGISFDADVGTLKFYKNGTVQNSGTAAVTGLTSGPYFFAQGASSSNIYANFGQRPFAYTAPSGYKALCTQNLPTPTIGATSTTLANKYFDINLWTGNGTSQTLTNSGGFQPDWVWLKSRSSGTNFHNLYDVLRGATKHLFSNSTAAEGTNAQALTAFTSTGFSVGNDNDVNQSSSTYVGWQWKANGAGSTNTSGSITSQVSANPTSGFSVVTWTCPSSGAGYTVGHGLGTTPAMIIIKERSSTNDWYVWHQSFASTTQGNLRLNTTAAVGTSSLIWNNTAPTSTVFSTYVGTTLAASGTGVAYCFAEVAGYSKFGSYTGNGNTNRNFVYLGFTPAVILVKRTSSSGTNWRIVTPRRVYLTPNTSDAEYASYPGPFLQTANGFEISAGDDVNENGGTFIYAAFASSPFKYALAQ